MTIRHTRVRVKPLITSVPNVELTGAVRLYRAAPSDRRARGWAPGYVSSHQNLSSDIECESHSLTGDQPAAYLRPDELESEAVWVGRW